MVTIILLYIFYESGNHVTTYHGKNQVEKLITIYQVKDVATYGIFFGENMYSVHRAFALDCRTSL